MARSLGSQMRSLLTAGEVGCSKTLGSVSLGPRFGQGHEAVYPGPRQALGTKLYAQLLVVQASIPDHSAMYRGAGRSGELGSWRRSHRL